MKKTFNCFLFIFTFLGLLFIGGLLAFINWAPTPLEIHEEFISEKKVSSLPVQKKKKKEEAKEIKAEISKAAEPAEPIEQLKRTKRQQTHKKIFKAIFRHAIETSADEDQTNFCKALVDNPRRIETLDDALSEMEWLSRNPDEPLPPILWANSGPIRETMKIPEVRDLLEAISNPRTKISFSEKALFYGDLLKAVHTFKKSAKEIEEKSDNYYLMGLYAKAVQIQPKILHDPDFSGECSAIADSSEKFSDLHKEKFLQLLKRNHIDSEKVGFNENYLKSTKGNSKFDEKSGGLSLTLDIPWTNSFFE